MDEPVAPERAWLCARVRAIRMIRGYRTGARYFAPSTTTLTKVARGLGVGRARGDASRQGTRGGSAGRPRFVIPDGSRDITVVFE